MCLSSKLYRRWWTPVSWKWPVNEYFFRKRWRRCCVPFQRFFERATCWLAILDLDRRILAQLVVPQEVQREGYREKKWKKINWFPMSMVDANIWTVEMAIPTEIPRRSFDHRNHMRLRWDWIWQVDVKIVECFRSLCDKTKFRQRYAHPTVRSISTSVRPEVWKEDG